MNNQEVNLNKLTQGNLFIWNKVGDVIIRQKNTDHFFKNINQQLNKREFIITFFGAAGSGKSYLASLLAKRFVQDSNDTIDSYFKVGCQIDSQTCGIDWQSFEKCTITNEQSKLQYYPIIFDTEGLDSASSKMSDKEIEELIGLSIHPCNICIYVTACDRFDPNNILYFDKLKDQDFQKFMLVFNKKHDQWAGNTENQIIIQQLIQKGKYKDVFVFYNQDDSDSDSDSDSDTRIDINVNAENNTDESDKNSEVVNKGKIDQNNQEEKNKDDAINERKKQLIQNKEKFLEKIISYMSQFAKEEVLLDTTLQQQISEQSQIINSEINLSSTQSSLLIKAETLISIMKNNEGQFELKLCQETLNKLSQVSNEKKCHVVSFLGLAGTGKSTIANSLLYLIDNSVNYNVFQVGHSLNTQTRAMVCSAIQKDRNVFIFLDLEGLFGFTHMSDEFHEQLSYLNALFNLQCIAYLISSCTFFVKEGVRFLNTEKESINIIRELIQRQYVQAYQPSNQERHWGFIFNKLSRKEIKTIQTDNGQSMQWLRNQFESIYSAQNYLKENLDLSKTNYLADAVAQDGFGKCIRELYTSILKTQLQIPSNQNHCLGLSNLLATVVDQSNKSEFNLNNMKIMETSISLLQNDFRIDCQEKIKQIQQNFAEEFKKKMKMIHGNELQKIVQDQLEKQSESFLAHYSQIYFQQSDRYQQLMNILRDQLDQQKKIANLYFVHTNDKKFQQQYQIALERNLNELEQQDFNNTRYENENNTTNYMQYIQQPVRSNQFQARSNQFQQQRVATPPQIRYQQVMQEIQPPQGGGYQNEQYTLFDYLEYFQPKQQKSIFAQEQSSYLKYGYPSINGFQQEVLNTRQKYGLPGVSLENKQNPFNYYDNQYQKFQIKALQESNQKFVNQQTHSSSSSQPNIQMKQGTQQVSSDQNLVRSQQTQQNNQIHDRFSFRLKLATAGLTGSVVGIVVAKLIDGQYKNNKMGIFVDVGTSLVIGAGLMFAAQKFSAAGMILVGGVGLYQNIANIKNKYRTTGDKCKRSAKITGTILTTSALGMAGGFAGQVVIPIPFVGAFIGGFIGGLLSTSVSCKVDSFMNHKYLTESITTIVDENAYVSGDNIQKYCSTFKVSQSQILSLEISNTVSINKYITEYSSRLPGRQIYAGDADKFKICLLFILQIIGQKVFNNFQKEIDDDTKFNHYLALQEDLEAFTQYFDFEFTEIGRNLYQVSQRISERVKIQEIEGILSQIRSIDIRGNNPIRQDNERLKRYCPYQNLQYLIDRNQLGPNLIDQYYPDQIQQIPETMFLTTQQKRDLWTTYICMQILNPSYVFLELFMKKVNYELEQKEIFLIDQMNQYLSVFENIFRDY
ncbi:hypothetical protein ABPG72_005069 [Tetrahymena utriculariae]